MKKSIIAVLIGAIIMFVYQALSWMMLPIHKNSMKYTPEQDSILQSMQGLEEGFYRLPNVPPGTSMSEAQETMKARVGQPWALVVYHESMSMAMGKQMAVGFILDLLAVWFFVWIVRKMQKQTLGSITTMALVVGIIIILVTHLMDWNWWTTPMHYVSGQIIDALLMWLLTGLWLGWYLSRKPKTAAV